MQKPIALLAMLAALAAMFVLPASARADDGATPAEAAGETPSPESAAALPDKTGRTSYALGMDIAGNLKRAPFDIDPEMLIKGLSDVLLGKPTLLTDAEVRETLMAQQREVVAKRQQLAQENESKGRAFLEENKKKEGVVALPSGLQYEVIEEGTGEMPGPKDMVTVHYTGTLIDGTEFDSSRSRGQPATFPVTGVIRGWTEALQLMKVGAKWRLYVPSNLAYGPRGRGALIGPNATLIFDVELVEIKPRPEPPALKVQPEEKTEEEAGE